MSFPFISNILTHLTFLEGKCHTKFIDETQELFDVVGSKDRATRILRYIANIQVSDPNPERKQYDRPRFPSHSDQTPTGLKQKLDELGPKGFSQ